jgi:glycopeptide antibiotics resistance protein
VNKILQSLKYERKYKNEKRIRQIALTLFWVYFAVLLYIILWKIGSPRIGEASERIINLTPFFNSSGRGSNTAHEMLFNIVIFLPFGVYLSWLKPMWSVFRRVIPTFATSFVLEVLQYILAVGRSDVTDLLLNTVGGLFGVLLYWLLKKLFKNNTDKILLAVCSVSTAAVFAALAYLFTHIRFR